LVFIFEIIILILLEYSLIIWFRKQKNSHTSVLILILLEYSLRSSELKAHADKMS